MAAWTKLCCRRPCARLPTTPEELTNLSKYENGSGYSAAVMRDIQRVYCCLEVGEADGNGMVDSSYVAKVAGFQSFGPRVIVPMSAQSEWRRGSLVCVGPLLCAWLSFNAAVVFHSFTS